jgi:hypothetical protein
VTGAHEIYMSRQARQFAPLRLTGNYGGEILRGVSTFKPAPLNPTLLSPSLASAMEASAQRLATWKQHQITFAAFREVPWNLSGNLIAGRSQLDFRTPYLDNVAIRRKGKRLAATGGKSRPQVTLPLPSRTYWADAWLRVRFIVLRANQMTFAQPRPIASDRGMPEQIPEGRHHFRAVGADGIALLRPS